MTDWYWGIPKATNEFKTSSISEDEIYRFQNEIWFSTTVNTKTTNQLIKLMHEALHDEKLSAYREQNNLELILHIDSYGGVGKDAFKFVDFVQQLKTKKVKLRTIINGCACSAGTIMALCGDQRQITQNSYAMIHELASITCGSYTQLKSYAKHLDDIHNQIVKFYHDQTGMEIEKIRELLLKETYYTAAEYHAAGFVHNVI